MFSNSDHQPCDTHRGQMQAARLGCETNIALGLGLLHVGIATKSSERESRARLVKVSRANGVARRDLPVDGQSFVFLCDASSRTSPVVTLFAFFSLIPFECSLAYREHSVIVLKLSCHLRQDRRMPATVKNIIRCSPIAHAIIYFLSTLNRITRFVSIACQ